jgi:hypothetical protein
MILSQLSLASFSQTSVTVEKEFRISGGLGASGELQNMKAAGPDFWIQFEYRMAKNFSIAMESEYMGFKQHGYYDNLPVDPNEAKIHDNNFSLLVKYHFPTSKKLAIALASGWTYCIRQTDYFIFLGDSTGQFWLRNVSSSTDYKIPLLIEISYPVSKKINITSRLKYNLNGHDEDTFSAGAGLSLAL